MTSCIRDNIIYCLAADTGSEIWTKTIGIATIALNAPSPVVADGKVYVGSMDHNVYCLDASNGSTIWQYATGNEIEPSPAVAGTVVYIASRDGKVYAFGTQYIPEFPTAISTILLLTMLTVTLLLTKRTRYNKRFL